MEIPFTIERSFEKEKGKGRGGYLPWNYLKSVFVLLGPSSPFVVIKNSVPI